VAGILPVTRFVQPSILNTMKWTWKDVDEIALDLIERYPNTDPLTVKLPELRTMVLELPNFADDPAVATDRVLESIQMAWYDEYED